MQNYLLYECFRWRLFGAKVTMSRWKVKKGSSIDGERGWCCVYAERIKRLQLYLSLRSTTIIRTAGQKRKLKFENISNVVFYLKVLYVAMLKWSRLQRHVFGYLKYQNKMRFKCVYLIFHLMLLFKWRQLSYNIKCFNVFKKYVKWR